MTNVYDNIAIQSDVEPHSHPEVQTLALTTGVSLLYPPSCTIYPPVPPSFVSPCAAQHYYPPRTVGAVESEVKPPPYEEAQNLPTLTGGLATHPSIFYATNYCQMPLTASASSGVPRPYYPPQMAYRPGGPVGYYPAPYPVQTTAPAQWPSPPQKQQQQQPVVLINTVHNAVQRQPVDSYAGQIVFACVVTWLCNILFGAVAFILAMVAQSKAPTDRKGARQLGHASVGVCIAGIVVTIIIIVAAVAVIAAPVSTPTATTPYHNQSPTTVAPSCNHYKSRVCYRHRSYASSSGECYKRYGSNSYYDSRNRYCYHNNTPTTATPSCTYYKSGSCYLYRSKMNSSSTCYRLYGNDSYYDSYFRYCYYNSNTNTTVPSCDYYISGVCYRYRTHVARSSTCKRVYGRSSYYESKDSYCYWLVVS